MQDRSSPQITRSTGSTTNLTTPPFSPNSLRTTRGKLRLPNEVVRREISKKKFWDFHHSNPQDFNSQQAPVAYVLPQDYAFGLRRADDKIWGLFEPDTLSGKVWGDVNKLVDLYGFGWDGVYAEAGVVDAGQNGYEWLGF